MNKFQRVSFHTYDDFFDFLPAGEQKLVEILRNLVYENIPDVREKISYNVPFYSRFRRICYIWPSVIPWGGLKPGSGVALGFTKGKTLQSDYLTGGKGKEVRFRLFASIHEIDRPLLADLLLEATVIDASERE
ncbi:DUF1801 domain-containing protein [Fulvivirga sedimenti]|uniref:DUF1801 domain-containing protein n=1 Tax=Fulvivirga sedimenti TaxID=2879465 RepID=A0A9X1HNT4_9BACT|nr:DUF1801 domain-containing protein [Fulvivirga sedimenti]MCA6074228.1 DUF1801 domain-containing protein [Fulvivirga sedimenti]